jgi:hypothetical protein
MPIFELKTNITSNSLQELVDTLDIIRQEIEEGYKTGHNKSETGQYFYEVSEDTGED